MNYHPVYTFSKISEFLEFDIQKENHSNHSIDIEVDDITMKINWLLGVLL